MDVKKLAELIYQNSPRLVEEESRILANRLIANGVTVQETTHLVCTGNDEYYGPFGLCHNCETDNICGSKFCRECGAKIEVEI